MYKIFRTINKFDSYENDFWIIRKHIKSSVWISIKNVNGSERLFFSEKEAKTALNKIQNTVGWKNE